jgi:nucleoside-diphosphate-sugar epimerase
MRVVIFGGHGKVALLLAPLLASRGDDAVAVIRNPDHAAEVRAAGAEPLVLDLERSGVDDLRDVIAGADAVVWSAGAGGGSPERTYAVDRDAAIRTMDAAAAAGVRRYVMVSWIGSVPDHGIDPDDGFFAYADAKLAADDRLRATALDWTILGPGTLTLDDPTGAITLDPAGNGDVPRADVAAVILAVLDEPHSSGRFLRFGSGTTPIAEAVANVDA